MYKQGKYLKKKKKIIAAEWKECDKVLESSRAVICTPAISDDLMNTSIKNQALVFLEWNNLVQFRLMMPVYNESGKILFRKSLLRLHNWALKF